MEYILLLFTKPNGTVGTALIEKAEYDEADGPEDFCEVGTTDIAVRGVVTITGEDDYLLDARYQSD